MMKSCFFFFVLALLLSSVAQAETVCVILNAGGTAVVGVVPCGQTYNPPATTLSTTDPMWTNYLGLQSLDHLLAVGIAQTFTTTTAANDNYSASVAALQYYLNLYQDNVTINLATSPFPVCTSPPVSVGYCPPNPNASAASHNLGTRAFVDLYNNAKAYSAAVAAAQRNAMANGTPPVWPPNAYSSAH